MGEGYMILHENRRGQVAPMSHTSLRDFFIAAPMIFAAVTKLAPQNATAFQHLTSFVEARRLPAGACDIFGVTAAILVNALGREFQHAVGQRCKKMPVMRDEEH